jgi:hypothetical protein
LPFHPIEVRSDTFRNANGVARKTVDIATHHPDYTGLNRLAPYCPIAPPQPEKMSPNGE